MTKKACLVCADHPPDEVATSSFVGLSASLLCKKCYAALIRAGDAGRLHTIDDVLRWASTRARRAERKRNQLKWRY